MSERDPHKAIEFIYRQAPLYADAFNGVVWRDDSQVVRVVSEKRYSDRPGVLVTVKEVRT